jgi:hypothetical protein
MRHFKKNTQAISVIVGALMLTLIVVTAATSFSLFVSQQQELRQKTEFASLQRELEQLMILQIQDPKYTSEDHLQSVNFSFANYHTQDSIIASIRINQNYVKELIVQRFDGKKEYWKVSAETGALRRGARQANDSNLPPQPYLFYDVDNDDNYSIGDIIVDLDYNKSGILAQPTFGDTAESANIIYAEYYYPLKIKPREQLLVSIQNATKDLYLTNKISIHNPITISILTTLTKDFSKTFHPPVAIIQLDMALTPPICDGTKSFTLSENGYILQWQWQINETGDHDPPILKNGSKITYNFTSGEYDIELTVTDNYGMISKDKIIYTHP